VKNIKRLVVVNACFLVLPSYILHFFLRVEINLLFGAIGLFCLLISLHESRWRVTRGVSKLTLCLFGFGVVGTALSGVFSQVLMAVSLSISFVVTSCGWNLLTDQRSLRYIILLTFLLIFGAVVGFVYAFSGGAPLAVIDLFGRDSFFYLTTFTNAVTGNLIRAAGIFDEPGALAMFIVLVVALNEALGVNTKWSAILLFSGLITGSFALFIIFILYVILKSKPNNILLVCFFLGLVGAAIAIDDRASTFAEEFFFKRVEVVDGRLAGDNRTHQVESFFELVDWDMTLKGQKVTKVVYEDVDQSSNPLSIYFGYGAVIWIPYASVLVWLLYCAIFYRSHLRFPALATLMVLAQRPYLYSLYWSMMIALVLITIYRVQITGVLQIRRI